MEERENEEEISRGEKKGEERRREKSQREAKGGDAWGLPIQGSVLDFPRSAQLDRKLEPLDRLGNLRINENLVHLSVVG